MEALEPKRLLFTAEYAKYAERFFSFYYKPFLLCDLCGLCGEKIFCKNGNIMPISYSSTLNLGTISITIDFL